MNQKLLFSIVILFFQFNLSWAQSDSTQTVIALEKGDTTTLSSPTNSKKKKKGNFIKRYFQKDYPSPKKAVVLTAILPGLGQIYNKKLWYIKLPLVYGAFGGLIYSIQYNGRNYRQLKREHRYLVDGLDCTTSVYDGIVTAEVLKNARDKFDKQLQFSYIGIGLAYILTAAEAYTTAHLLTFDVSDDLSMRFKPSFDVNPSTGMTVGFGVNFIIGKKKNAMPKDFLK
ncbi:MAG: DUF5683 domain-containing protein [Saprospiraceae bacterium]